MYQVLGGSNSVSVSRRNLESSALFTVTTNSGIVGNIDVSQATEYSLQVLGGNGLTTSVAANIVYVKASANCILNETSQVLG